MIHANYQIKKKYYIRRPKVKTIKVCNNSFNYKLEVIELLNEYGLRKLFL